MSAAKKLIYLDHAATTPIAPEVLKAMRPWLTLEYGNPSALYDLGVRGQKALEASRKIIADILNATADTIVFTSGGTESNNLAIFGVLPLPRGEGQGVRARGHFITTPIEHDSVLGPMQQLKKEGCEVTYVKVDKEGLINPGDVIRAIRPESVLVSVMYANNEIGTIEPVTEIGRKILRYRKEHNTPYPYFHVDACQAAGYLDLDVEKLHVDLMTMNGSKIYGPKGVGMLYVRRGVKLKPLMYGGQQERGWRPGTENVAGIVGLAKALSLVQTSPYKGEDKGGGLRKLSKYFWKELQKKIPNVVLNGPEIGERRLPNNLNIQFPKVEGEALLLYLNEAGIMCSTGSACGLESGEPSHVLRAIGLADKQTRESLRFSLGLGTNKENIAYVVHTIAFLINTKLLT